MDAVNTPPLAMPTTGNINSSYRILPTKRGFKLGALNVNSLSAHIDEIHILLAENPLDILAINETKFNESNQDNEVYVPEYEIVRRDRLLDGGGGVCFYIRTNINYSIGTDLNVQNLENLCIEIRKHCSKPFIVATWYRPPDSLVEIFNPFESLVGKLDSLGVEYYLLGDFNCNMISNTDNNTRLLNEVADIYGLHQLITEPTRITQNTSTLIDVVFTNCPDRIVCSGVKYVGISDHSLVYAYRKLSADSQSRGHKTVTYRKLKNFCSASFRNDIAKQNWESLEQIHDPNVMWNEWKRMFLSCADKHAPLRTKRARGTKSPWINTTVKKLMHERDILKIKAIRTREHRDWLKFKKHRNFVNNQIKAAKEEYHSNAFRENEGSIRNTWRVINELTSRKSANSTIKEIKVNGNSITGSHELADTFNSHFSTNATDLASKIPINDSISHLDYLTTTSKTFELRTTNSSKVFTLLSI